MNVLCLTGLLFCLFACTLQTHPKNKGGKEKATIITINNNSNNNNNNRASDRSWKRKSNFAGFLGTNSRKNRPIVREFSGQTSPKSNR